MEKIKSIKYGDLMDVVNGRDVKEIIDILSTEYDLFKKPNNIDVFVAVDDTVRKILGLDCSLPSMYLFLKKEVVFFNALELFTNIQNLPKDVTIEELSFELEYAFRVMSLNINSFYEMVEEGVKIKHQEVLNQLTTVFDTKIPTVEELESVKSSLDEMFKDESPEKLKIINDILAFNDPTMVGIKDAINQAGIENIQKQVIKENK